MTREDLKRIIARDLPGWTLAADWRMPRKAGDDLMVTVCQGSMRKTAVVNGRRVTGMQG